MKQGRRTVALAVVAGAFASVLGMAGPAHAATVDRIGGADRYDTAARLSAASFTPDTNTVFVATGLGFADALAAGPSAAKKGAPILLTQTDALPAVTKAEIQRLTPTEIIVVGGTQAVTANVENELKSIATTRRISGATRYDTAKAISADAFQPGIPVAYVASGVNFPDALGGGAAGGELGGPILLTEPGAIPTATASELDRLDPASIVVLGGTSAVAPAVATSAGSYGPVRRISGPDRFATSAGISRDTFKSTAPTVILATGLAFPDALAGSAAAARANGPLLLVNRDCVPRSVNADIDRLKPSKILLLGGETVATSAVVARNTCPDTGAKVLGKDLNSVANPNGAFGPKGGTINSQDHPSTVYTIYNCDACDSASYGTRYVEYDLGGDYASFSTTAGNLSISPQGDDGYRFEVLLDGVVAFSKEITGLTASEVANLNVVGVSRIRLQVTRLTKPNYSYPAFGSPTVYTS